MDVREQDFITALSEWSAEIVSLYEEHPILFEVEDPDEIPHSVQQRLWTADNKIVEMFQEIVNLPKVMVMETIGKTMEDIVDEPVALDRDTARIVYSRVIKELFAKQSMMPGKSHDPS